LAQQRLMDPALAAFMQIAEAMMHWEVTDRKRPVTL